MLNWNRGQAGIHILREGDCGDLLYEKQKEQKLWQAQKASPEAGFEASVPRQAKEKKIAGCLLSQATIKQLENFRQSQTRSQKGKGGKD